MPKKPSVVEKSYVVVGGGDCILTVSWGFFFSFLFYAIMGMDFVFCVLNRDVEF